MRLDMSFVRRATFFSVLLTPLCAAIALGAVATWQKIDKQGYFANSEGASVTELPDGVQVQDGAAMMEPTGNSTIHLPLCTVQPKRHALVFVRSRPGCEHVFVLLGNATIHTGDHINHLNAGEEAIIADHDPSVQELLNADYIGRRRLRMAKLPSGKSVGVAEFSLVHAVEREPVLYRLMHSNDAHDRALRARLIKMAAVLNYVTGTHGGYITGR